MEPINTYLLTWNPAKYSWDDIDHCIHEISVHGHFNRYWSCGRSKKLKPGDRFFLLRQKIEPRGIVASGYVTSEPYKDVSDYNTSGWSRYVRASEKMFYPKISSRKVKRNMLLTGHLEQ